MKPHIQFWGTSSVPAVNHWWKCEGAGHVGGGSTPTTAFDAWQRTVSMTELAKKRKIEGSV